MEIKMKKIQKKNKKTKKKPKKTKKKQKKTKKNCFNPLRGEKKLISAIGQS